MATSSRTEVNITPPHATLSQLRTGIATIAVGHIGQHGTLSAMGVLRQPGFHAGITVDGCSAGSVDAAITAGLIQRRDNQRREPPGGVLETAETIPDGLRREVREETGLDIEPVALTGVYKNMTRGIVALVFRCKITGGELRASAETAAYRWATPAEVTELAT